MVINLHEILPQVHILPEEILI